MAFCPVYRLDRTETSNMRGKLALLQAIETGRTIPPGAVRKALSRCVGCLTCRATCPNKVDTGLATILGKWHHAPVGPVGSVGQFVARLLRRSAVGRSLLVFAEEQHSSGMRLAPIVRHLLQMMRGRKCAKIYNNTNNKSGGLLLVPGCRLAGNDASCGAAVKLAEAAGLAGDNRPGEIFDGGCCGLPALAAGDLEGYADAVSRLMDVLARQRPQAILFLCPECWYAWRLAPELCELIPVEQSVWKMGAEFHAALAASGWQPGIRIEGRLAFHEACLYARGGGDREAPRRLVERMAAEKPVRSFREGTCCGARGGLVYDDPGMARRIAADRLDELRAAGAETVVTHCDRCRSFFGRQPEAQGMRVTSLLDLLGETMNHG